MNILLKGGRVIDPANNRDEVTDVAVGDGIVVPLEQLDLSHDCEVIDCSGKVVAPGLIDLHVHLRVPGQEYKEDIVSGTAAAAAGGFTRIVCQPNTQPPIDHPSIVGQILEQAAGQPCRVGVVAAVSKGLEHEELCEIADLREAGAMAIGDDAFPVQSSGFLRRAMEYTHMLGLPFFAHCEDKSLTGDGLMNEGYNSTVLGLKGISRAAEDIGTARNILLSRTTGCHLHILHVSTRESVEIIRFAKRHGSPISCETCPQYFSLTDSACLGYNTNAKMSPPLRTSDDVEAVIEGLQDGTIDAIATDHAPHAPHEKEREFAAAPFGMIGLESALAVSITHLVETGKLTLSQLITKMSYNPSRILGGLGGNLRPGSVADITVFDPGATWTVKSDTFRSKSRNTAYDGVVLTGKPAFTILNGNLVKT